MVNFRSGIFTFTSARAIMIYNPLKGENRTGGRHQGGQLPQHEEAGRGQGSEPHRDETGAPQSLCNGNFVFAAVCAYNDPGARGTARTSFREEVLAMGMMKEFKEFALRQCGGYGCGHHHRCGIRQDRVIAGGRRDHAPIGLALGGVNFSDLAIVLKAAVDQTPAVTLNYGTFIRPSSTSSSSRWPSSS